MPMKFRAHETFFIRKGWLSKGMRCVNEKSDVFVSKDENPMDVFGIGSNMVKSLRYWLQVVGLTEEPKSGKRNQVFTGLGKTIFDNDRYIEELGTLYLLQYKLASDYKNATAWYFFFNVFSITEFTKEDFVEALQKFVKMNNEGESVAVRSLTDDFNCIISTYLPKTKTDIEKVNAENNIDCPFGELGLIDIVNKTKKVYRKRTPSAQTINPLIALAVIVAEAKGRDEIPLNSLLNDPCNIGKVFNLDSITMLDILYKVEKTGAIKINRTAGLDVIKIETNKTFQDCVDEYYKQINQ